MRSRAANYYKKLGVPIQEQDGEYIFTKFDHLCKCFKGAKLYSEEEFAERERQFNGNRLGN